MTKERDESLLAFDTTPAYTEKVNALVAQGSKSQADRFRETAKKLGADQDEGALDRVFGKVVPPVLPKAPSSSDGEGDQPQRPAKGS